MGESSPASRIKISSFSMTTSLFIYKNLTGLNAKQIIAIRQCFLKTKIPSPLKI